MKNKCITLLTIINLFELPVLGKKLSDGEKFLNAAKNGNLTTVQELIGNGLDINVTDQYGQTALMIAVENDRNKIAKYLIIKGCNVNKITTAYAVDFSALMVASWKNNLQIAKFLLKNKADVNICDGGPLRRAAGYGHMEMVKLLLKNGADINAGIKTNQYTALMVAVDEGHLPVVRFLIKENAKVNAHLKDGDTALFLAASKGKLQIVKELVRNGAEVNVVEKEYGWTPFLKSCTRGWLEQAIFLYKNGADINAESKHGNCESLAKEQNYKDIIEFLNSIKKTEYKINVNHEINREISNIIKKQNNTLFKSLKENKPKIMYEMLVEEEKREGVKSIERFYSHIHGEFKENKTSKVNDYHVKILKKGRGQRAIIPDSITGNFFINVPTGSSDSVVSLHEIKIKNGVYLISIIYMKRKSRWMLYSFRIGKYKFYGMTAADMYNKAKKMYELNHKLNSFLWLTKVDPYLKPSSFISYNNSEEIIAFRFKVLSELKANYTFPIALNKIKTKPEIYSVNSVFVKNELIPVVVYRSSIYLKSEKSLRKEATSITKQMEKIFPGITKYQKNIIFQIFADQKTDPGRKLKSKALHIDIK